MHFRKVIAEDCNAIIELFNNLDDSVSNHEVKKRLFEKQFECEEDFFGILIEDKNKIIGYLGLIFANRRINGQMCKFCNLTSFLIDPDYRGQKLTHRIIDEVIKLGDYTITAITPIPSLYRMYESKGLVKLSDYRIVFWNSKVEVGSWKIEKNDALIEKGLDRDNFQIYHDHKKFKGVCEVLTDGKQFILFIGKKYYAQVRKFKTGKFINYTDYLTRKVIKKSILDRKVETLDLAYCSDYVVFLDHFQAILSLLSSNYLVEGIILREDIVELNRLRKFKQNRFWKARQLFLSNQIRPNQYDTLYSEIFVLD